jgi:hypothetical protein
MSSSDPPVLPESVHDGGACVLQNESFQPMSGDNSHESVLPRPTVWNDDEGHAVDAPEEGTPPRALIHRCFICVRDVLVVSHSWDGCGLSSVRILLKDKQHRSVSLGASTRRANRSRYCPVPARYPFPFSLRMHSKAWFAASSCG